MKPSPLLIMAALALLHGLGPVAAQSPPEILRIDTSFLQLDSIVPFGHYVGDDAEAWEQLGQGVSDWKAMGRTALNLPAYTSRWLRITLHNPYDFDVPLQLDASSIDIHRMSWIETSDGVELSRKETGCAYPVAARPSKSASMGINFLLPRGATRTYYAHVQSAWTPIQTGIHVVNAWYANWAVHKVRERTIVGFVVGMGTMLALIALLLLLFFRQEMLLWYAVYVVSGVMYMWAAFGAGAEWLWGAYPHFEEMSAELFGTTSLMGFTMMARLVYRTRQEYRAADYYLLGMVAIGMVFLLSACFRFALPHILVYGLMIVSAAATLPGLVLIGVMGGLRWFWHGEQEQRWFFAMFLYGMFFTAVTLMTSFGWIPISGWTVAYLPFLSVIVESCMATIFIAGFLRRQILKEQQEKLRVQLQRERELKEISSGLHDEVGSMLSSAIILSDMAGWKLAGESEHQARLTTISQRLQEVYNALRDLAWLWNPNQEPLSQAMGRLRVFAEEILNASGIRLHFDYGPGVESIQMVPLQCRDIYFLGKEAVNNAAKYSQASEVWLSIRHENGHLCLAVRDNGRGFDPAAAQNGNGLAGMKYRAARLGAELEIKSEKNGGVLVSLRMPIA